MNELKEVECYECNRLKTALSPRSRCITCEYRRAQFNEEENESLRYTLAESQKRITELEKERYELLNNFMAQLSEECEKFISLSNDVVEGLYLDNTPEGSIYNEKAYVEARLQDIKDPLYVSLQERLKKRDLEQQAKGAQFALELCEENGWGWNGDCGLSGDLELLIETLRKQAEQLK